MNNLSTTIYKIKCKHCEAETPHLILIVSRKHGIKLKCAYCNKETKFYNARTLEEWK